MRSGLRLWIIEVLDQNKQVNWQQTNLAGFHITDDHTFYSNQQQKQVNPTFEVKVNPLATKLVARQDLLELKAGPLTTKPETPLNSKL